MTNHKKVTKKNQIVVTILFHPESPEISCNSEKQVRGAVNLPRGLTSQIPLRFDISGAAGCQWIPPKTTNVMYDPDRGDGGRASIWWEGKSKLDQHTALLGTNSTPSLCR